MNTNENYGQFTAPGEVRLVRTLPGPIERVWEYLTDSEKRGRWFAGGPMEPRKGGKATLTFRHKNLAPDETPPDDHKQYHDPGESMQTVVTRWDPPRVLGYRFGEHPDSEVVFELTPEGKNVVLVLTHRACGDDQRNIKGYAAGWHTHFAQLAAQLEGAPRPPFWPMHAKLQKEYNQMNAEAKTS